MISRQKVLSVSFQVAGSFLILAVIFCVQVDAKRSTFVSGRRAIVVDERISALRALPDLKAPLRQRLRRGRVVGILRAAKNDAGARFFKVAISRNTQGWVLADAVVRKGNLADAQRLMGLVEAASDDFTKMRLARLCADEYRKTKFAPRALLLLGKAAEGAADRLTREAMRRIGEVDSTGGLTRRLYFLSYAGLDRYNRIGVTFDYDETEDRIIYDGKAYRELLRRYPRSDEAVEAREKADRSKRKINSANE
jgi:hypothetical protein